MEEADLQNVNVVLMLKDFYLLWGGGVCVFIFQLVGVELKTNQITLHVALPDADTQGLLFFVPCTPPTSLCVCVCFFSGTKEIWLPDFQQMLLSFSSGLAIFSHHPVLSFLP